MTLNDAQVREVEAALGAIVGLPLVVASLDPPGPSLLFDEPRRTPATSVWPRGGRALWQLCVACAWGLEGPDGAIRAEGRPWEITDDERARFARLVDARLPVVAVAVRRDGALRLSLDGGNALFVYPGGPFDLERETTRTSLRWSLEAPGDDPRGTLCLRLGQLTREPMRPPPPPFVGSIPQESSKEQIERERNVTRFGHSYWKEPWNRLA